MNLAVLAERNVERFGEYESLIFEDRTLTNAEQLADAHRLSNVLTGLGVRPGDRVAVMMPNCPEVFTVYGGATAVGAVSVPIVFLLAVPEVNHILANSEPKVVVTGPELLGTVQMAVEGLRDHPRIVVTGPNAPDGVLSFDALMWEASSEFAYVDRDDGDLAVIMYTGGTTGQPKGVMISHGNLYWNATTLAEMADIEPGDMSLLALPVSHLFGLIAALTGQVLGVRGVLLRWFTPDAVLEAVQRYRVAYIPMVPTMAQYLLQHPEAGRFDTSSLKTVVMSAAPVPIELKESFARAFDCEVVEAYGQTEASPAIAVERRGEEKRPGSCGKALNGVAVAIMDEGGSELPPGEVGEICAKGPGIMTGYYHLADATDEALKGGWLHTGDMGYLDADGYLYVTDRKTDLIIRGGFNVYPRDVEEVLFAHPGVAEAAVVGRPDPVMGEEVAAFVVLGPGAHVTEEELLAYCRERLAGYKAPREIRFVPTLPKSPIGKVLKKELRASLRPV
jgi:long-chain acyl-CoA synthetase